MAAVRFLLTSVLFVVPSLLVADNCFISARPTSEPAPVVFTWNDEERLYVYCSQDIINGSGVYPVDTIHCYSSTDMFHWRDEGVSLYEKAINWADHTRHRLWAAHVAKVKSTIAVRDTVKVNDKDTIVIRLKDTTIFRLTASEDSSDNFSRIFTAMSLNPAGPFTAGPPLPGMAKEVSDPFIFIDPLDTPLVWMSYRHQDTRSLGFVRMDDSASLIIGDINQALVNIGSGAPSGYLEGSSMIKHKEYFFLIYSLAPGSSNEMIAYSTSRSCLGPWTYRGRVLLSNDKPSEYTIHAGAVEFKDQWYLFYHNVTFGGSLFGSSRCAGVEYLYFTNDSTIDTARLSKTNRGVGIPQAGKDTIQVDRGVVSNARIKTLTYNLSTTEQRGWFIDSINGKTVVRYDSINFTPDSGKKIGMVFARIAGSDSAGMIEVRLDDTDGVVLGTIPIPIKGLVETWTTTDSVPLSLTPPMGIRNIVLKFKSKGTNTYYINWIGFGEIPEDGVLDRKIAAASSGCSLHRIGRNRFTVLGLRNPKNARIRVYNLAGRAILGALHIQPGEGNSIFLEQSSDRLSTGVYIIAIRDLDRKYAMKMRIDP